jgi:hypothetical protein
MIPFSIMPGNNRLGYVAALNRSAASQENRSRDYPMLIKAAYDLEQFSSAPRFVSIKLPLKSDRNRVGRCDKNFKVRTIA